MELVPGVYPLGEDATLNIIALLTKNLGSRVDFVSADLDFTADDTLVYRVVEQDHTLLFVPAPTEAQIKAGLIAVGIDWATATDEEKKLMRELLKRKGGA